MEPLSLTQEMERHDVLVAIAAHYSDLKITSFLNVARSFVFRVRHELETSSAYVALVAKRKKHTPRLGAIRTPEFVQQVRKVVVP